MSDPAPSWISPELIGVLEAEGTDAHRLCSGRGGWTERFGRDALVSWWDAGFRDAMRAGLADWARRSGLGIERIFERELPRQPEARATPVLLKGDAARPLESVVLERGVRSVVDFSAGYSVGLFLDQRCNRALVRHWCPRRTLNLFAYTCSFSVAAALGGGSTTSVDLSRRSLDRGRQNFSLNGLDPAAHTFIAADVLRVLPRLARQNQRFDCLIVDPPTFSRGERGKTFRVVRDLADLALAAMSLADTKGRIMLSTNSAKMTEADVYAAARYALKASRRGADLHREPPPPDVPAEQAAKTLWILLKD
ncbi:MAG TPA: class I SAM-dependent methyltransferase [Verrucomicrobiae bacterium]|nr:class I SAM-dependent methyltransferase [Verrucomicrobiae bacterium]